jgi:FAD-dependent urate hydroxylase
MGSREAARDAIIIGGGIAGLAVGTALRRAGIQVAIYELAPTLEPRGAALSLWPNAKQALARIGMLAPVEAVSAHIDSLSIAMKSGNPLIRPIALADPGLVVERTDLQKALGAPLEDVVHLGSTVAGVVAEHQRPRVLVNGQELSADLVVDASGLHSTTADALIGNSAKFRKFGGVVAITEASDERPMSKGYEWVASGERAGLFPLTSGRSYWYFTRDQLREDALPSLDEIAGRTDQWPSAFKAAVARTRSDRAYQVVIHARERPSRLGRGQVICIGDAAHGMEPTLGQGACQALEDAATLCELATRLPPSEILNAFEQKRLSRVRHVMGRSSFWTHAAHGQPILQKIVRTITRLTPSGVLDRSMEEIHRMPT